MRLPDSKKYMWSGILLFALLGVAAGVLLLVLSAELLLKIAFVIMGIITVISSIPGLTVGLMHLESREGKLAAISSLISAVLGFLMIFWHSGILMVLLGVYMIVLPLIGVLTASDKGTRLRAELPKLILGVVLLLVGPARTLEVLFDVAGWCILALTAIGVVVMLLTTRKKQVASTGGRIFADTDGDGSIDTVYVDTTGTVKRIRLPVIGNRNEE